MIGRNKYTTIGSFKDFSERGKDTDKYSPLLRNYTDRVKEEIIQQLKEHKGLSQNDAEDFLDNLFSLGEKRLKEIKEIISDSYSKEESVKTCAETVIYKFYKLTKVNKYDEPYTHEEITEIQESLLNKLEGPDEEDVFYNAINSYGDEQYKILKGIIKNGYKDIIIELFNNNISINEENGSALIFDAVDYEQYDILDILLKNGLIPSDDSIFYARSMGEDEIAIKLKKYKNESKYITENRFYHFKDVSKSLFWYFMRLVDNLNIRFEFNTSVINDNDNSLNTKDYIFYIESDSMNKEDVVFEFSNSKLLSKTVDIINENLDENINLFVGINKLNKIRFGYNIGGMRYVIGNVDYKSNDLSRLSKHIKYISNDINIIDLSKKFKSSLTIINNLKDILLGYLQHYTDLKILVDVKNNNFCLNIYCDDEDILNANYINKILNSNKVYRLNVEFNLEEIKKKNITIYQITIK